MTVKKLFEDVSSFLTNHFCDKSYEIGTEIYRNVLKLVDWSELVYMLV